jgi:hypothetical protein
MKKGIVSPIIFAAILSVVLAAVGGVAVAAGPDLSGNWHGSNGADYNIVQIGTTFNWKVPATGEVGVGNVTGTTCSAGWPFGFATGNIITDPAGNAVGIHWSNGVNFVRIGPPPGVSGPGGPPPGPGPTPGPGPVPGPGPTPPPPGGSSSELDFSFGPNPAWPGAEVWVNLSLPVAHKVLIWHNGSLMPITSFKGNNFLVVKLPMKVSSGPFRVDYQGKRLDSKQSKNELEIKPIDISGNWVSMASGTGGTITCKTTIIQNGERFMMDVTTTLSGMGTSSKSSLNGSIDSGDTLRIYTSDGRQISGSIKGVDKDGRAIKMSINSATPGFEELSRP